MVYVVGLLAAASIGFGWVLQQRAAVREAGADPLSPRLVGRLLRDGMWWLGIAGMLVGNGLWAFSLHLGTVSVVEPLLATSLVFAFVIAALLRRQLPPVRELAGAVLTVGALAGFVIAAQPQAAKHTAPDVGAALAAAAVVALAVGAIVAVGRRRSFPVASTAFATAAGVLYGLQDVSARWSLVALDGHGMVGLLSCLGTYLVGGTALGGLFLSQSAFGAARLANSLPSLTVTEPLVGTALGVALLGDRLVASSSALAAETACLVGLVYGVILVGRSFRPAPLPSALAPISTRS